MKTAREILEEHRKKDDSLPHWITVKHALLAMEEYKATTDGTKLDLASVSKSLADANIFNRYDIRDFLQEILPKYIIEDNRFKIMGDFQLWVTKLVEEAEASVG